MKCGGTQAVEVTQHHIDLLSKHLPELEKESQLLGRNGLINNNNIKIVSVASQVVAGTNYFMNLQITNSDDEHIWLRIYEDLSGNTNLHSIKIGKLHSESLEYF